MVISTETTKGLEMKSSAEIIETIEKFAIEKHTESINYIEYTEIEQKKHNPNLKTIDLYKRLMLEASNECNIACKLLDMIFEFPQNQSHYVNYKDEIAVMKF